MPTMKGLLTISALSLLISSISAAQAPVAHARGASVLRASAAHARAPVLRASSDAHHARTAKAPIKKLVLPTDDVCVPDTIFPAYDNCNTCTCTCSGLVSDAICTEKLECCRTFNDICFSGTYFYPDENTMCECPDSGLESEATNCVNLVDPILGDPNPNQGKTCIPGDLYTNGGFLYCTCPDSGIQEDTIDGFGDCLYIDPLPIPCGKCTPGATFKNDDGSKCTCPPSGFKSETSSCFIEPEPDCTPGTNFIREEDGYTCTCPDTGFMSDTTSCYINFDVCTPGTTFLNDDGLTTCTCPSSGIKSEAVCPTTPPSTCEPTPYYTKNKSSSHLRCSPGSWFPAGDGCNSCECPDSGIKSQAVECTNQPCIIPDVE